MADKTTNSAKDIAESVAYIVLGMVLAAAGYGILGAVLGTSNPVVTVVSSSMEPALHRGDLLILEGATVSELREGRQNGSIIVYNYPPADKLIVHRVWKINTDTITGMATATVKTWGDNNPAPDPWNVEPGWIRGKMVLQIPYLGYPRLWLKDFLGF